MASTADQYASRIVETQERPGDDRDCPCRRSARAGHGLTHCFLHADNTASLNVEVKNGELLVHCHGGCEQQEIVRQLREMEMFPPLEERKNGHSKPTVVAEYDYTDENGKVLFQAVRKMPKGFYQRRPDGQGGWINNVEGVRLVPYHLPDVLAAGTRRVFVVEGEKDADRLKAEGYIATTSPMGAGKWRAEYAEHFRDLHVVLVPDNDEVGRKHMHDVARSLRGIAASVVWLDLPGLSEHGDVSDYLAAHSIEELLELARHAGTAPHETERQRVFTREGLRSYKIELAEAPVVVRLSRIKDKGDDTRGELHMVRTDGSFVLRRQVNLLAASGTTFTQITKDLDDAELGTVDWKLVLRREFEAVLDAHRNGLVPHVVQGRIERPAEPAWLCDKLVMQGKLNCWLGAAGTGKSTLAKALCAYHGAGYRFLNRETTRGCALYLDWEDDSSDFDRVFYDVSRNLGLDGLPMGVWLPMRGKRLSDNIESLSRIIVQHNVTLVVIDAIAAAGGSGGEHRNYEDIALEIEEAMNQLPPVTILALDHVTSQEHKDRSNARSPVPVKARGSERKVEIFRNQWTLMLDNDEADRGRHVVSWYHTKINRGRKSQPFTCELVYKPDELAINAGSIDRSGDAIERMKTSERALYEVRHIPGRTTAALALVVRESKSDSAVESTRSELKRHRQHGLINDVNGKWYPCDPSAAAAGQEELPPYWTGDK